MYTKLPSYPSCAENYYKMMLKVGFGPMTFNIKGSFTCHWTKCHYMFFNVKNQYSVAHTQSALIGQYNINYLIQLSFLQYFFFVRVLSSPNYGRRALGNELLFVFFSLFSLFFLVGVGVEEGGGGLEIENVCKTFGISFDKNKVY